MLHKRCFFAWGIWVVLASVAWAAPQKALIVDGQNGHNWKEATPILKKLLEETGLFSVDVATSPPKGQDMSGFKPNFAGYDVVISNYQGDSWPEETQQALGQYVKGGGGLVSSDISRSGKRSVTSCIARADMAMPGRIAPP